MKIITPNETFQLMQNEKITLIDVREKDETDAAYIETAQFAPLSNLPQAIESVNIPKDQKVIVHCLKGGRSAKAIEFLSENILKGYDVYNMVGGIEEWANQDLPITYPNK